MMSQELIEKLEKSSEKLLEFIEKTGEQTVDFAREQVPLVIQEVLEWGFYSHLINAVGCLFIVIFLVIILKKTWKYLDDSPIVIVWGAGVIICFALTCAMFHSGTTCVKIKVAPRLYLIESLNELVRR